MPTRTYISTTTTTGVVRWWGLSNLGWRTGKAEEGDLRWGRREEGGEKAGGRFAGGTARARMLVAAGSAGAPERRTGRPEVRHERRSEWSKGNSTTEAGQRARRHGKPWKACSREGERSDLHLKSVSLWLDEEHFGEKAGQMQRRTIWWPQPWARWQTTVIWVLVRSSPPSIPLAQCA